LDVARCLALLGMVATHVVEERTPDGDLTTLQWLAGGRASALFAVLAGVSMALMSGREEPLRGEARARRSFGLALRAVFITLVGLLLGELTTGIAVILVYYGLLFLLGLVFLGLRARQLWVLAAVWVVVGPVLNHWIGPHVPMREVAVPAVRHVADPWQLVTELLFTGYYPVLPWLAYLFVGLALGRSDLRGPRLLAVVTTVGAALAVQSTALSHALTRDPGVQEALLVHQPSYFTADDLFDDISEGMGGTVPSGGAWEWLLVVAPHSATPFDLAQTIGSALATIGACMLLVRWLPAVGRRVVTVVFGAGTMTLTLYSLHVVMRTAEVWPEEEPESFRLHVLVLLGIGAAYALFRRRGPLERLASAMTHIVPEPAPVGTGSTSRTG
jgi:uncharacterized membrane protein